MLETVLSPADHIEGLPDKVIFDMCIEGIKEDFPLANEAEVLKWGRRAQAAGGLPAVSREEQYRPFQRSP